MGTVTPTRILKFTLEPGITVIDTADAPLFLSVGTQGDDVVVWAAARVGNDCHTSLASVMTGEVSPDDGIYVGTTQLVSAGQRIVVHVFARRA